MSKSLDASELKYVEGVLRKFNMALTPGIVNDYTVQVDDVDKPAYHMTADMTIAFAAGLVAGSNFEGSE